MQLPTASAEPRHRTTRQLPPALVAAMAVVVLAGCDDPLPPDPEPASMTLIPSNLTLTAVGEAARIRAVVMDAQGDTLTGHSVDWATSDEAVATVNPGGVVRATGPGTARITATAGSVSADAAVRVVDDADRQVLKVLYHATGGADWVYNTGWMTDRPLAEWYGVETDADGNVVALDLSYNGLSGSIPVRIGDLAHLRRLDLSYNPISGSIPGEVGNLSELRVLNLGHTSLSGSIPAEVGNLAGLQMLVLGNSSLSGSIPSEIGNLAELRNLHLQNNGLSGSIPPEVGDLAKLRVFDARANELSGEIPEVLGDLSELAILSLGGNDLAGPFPAWVTGMPQLMELMLSGNPHTGGLPGNIGDMAGLERLLLANTGLSGLLPLDMTRLQRLDALILGGTQLCAPDDEGFRAWLEGVPSSRVPACVDRDRSAAYLVQAVQSLDHPAPLIAGERALARVFVVAPAAEGETAPPVRAIFHLNGEVAHVAEIEAGSSLIGREVNEGSLDASANVEIPASVLQPGLEMVVEIDPDSTMDPALGVTRRIPETGRRRVDVRRMPELEFTLIPFLWASDPDSAIIDITEDLSTDDELLWPINTLLPVANIDLEVHDPVVSTTNDAYSLIEQTQAIRAAENGSGYFMGTMSGGVSAAFGVAVLSGWSSFSVPDSSIMAHELGHNLSLEHAPCGGAALPDPLFPEPDGSIGAWGYDFDAGELVEPSTSDVMSYCRPSWISEFFFAKSLRHRLDAETGERRQTAPGPSLLIWGGTDSEGVPYLRPAFVIDAGPSLQRSPGSHRLTGIARDGGEIFALDFDMPSLADADGRGSFAFTVPAQAAWADDLVGIRLSGPGGSVTLATDATRPAAIVRDPRTGKVRGILTDLPRGADAEGVLGGGGFEGQLEVLFSRGIPGAAAWRR